MQEYQLIEENDFTEFNTAVNNALQERWELYGNLVIIPQTSDEDRLQPAVYLHSMVRTVKQPNKKPKTMFDEL